eukprot:COSAG04_NODE_25351_length_308_cov_5.401914_1_plen_48_part_01
MMFVRFVRCVTNSAILCNCQLLTQSDLWLWCAGDGAGGWRQSNGGIVR